MIAKLIVVIDASTKSTSGLPFNDILMLEPHIKQELLWIILRFRALPFIVCVHIVDKLFCEVTIDTKDKYFLWNLWRDSSQDPIEEYSVIIVTYGTVSTHLLWTRILHQLTLD